MFVLFFSWPASTILLNHKAARGASPLLSQAVAMQVKQLLPQSAHHSMDGKDTPRNTSIGYKPRNMYMYMYMIIIRMWLYVLYMFMCIHCVQYGYTFLHLHLVSWYCVILSVVSLKPSLVKNKVHLNFPDETTRVTYFQCLRCLLWHDVNQKPIVWP